MKGTGLFSDDDGGGEGGDDINDEVTSSSPSNTNLEVGDDGDKRIGELVCTETRPQNKINFYLPKKGQK